MTDAQMLSQPSQVQTNAKIPRLNRAQLSAIVAAVIALENSERKTRCAAVELVKLGERDGAEVTERHANEMLQHLQILRAMVGIQSTQHSMPQFESEKTK